MKEGAEGAPPAFRLSGVGSERGGVRALSDVTIEIPAGEVTALIGPSAAGKTALLRLLNRLDEPTHGSIEYRGQPVVDIPVGALRRRAGFVFQTPVVFPGTVGDNFHEAARISGIAAGETEELIGNNLALVELDADLLERPADRLSVGQKQRLNIGRALMTRPETLLLDESTASLDPETSARLVETIAHLRDERGLTVIMATHRLAEATSIADYVVMLDGGEVVAAGTASEVLNASNDPRVRAFVGGGN